MGLSSRLVLYNVFGYSAQRGFSFSFAGLNAYLRAKSRPNALVNILALGDTDTPGNTAPYGTNTEGRKFGLTLQGRINFIDTTGEKSTWTATNGGSYLEDLPDPFGDGTAGLQYALSEYDSIGEFFSGTNLIKENTPWAVRYRQARFTKTAGNQNFPVNTFRAQGSTGGLGFQVMVSKGNASMMLLTPQWTQVRETQLFGWLSLDTIDDTTQALIDGRRQLIYTEETPINLQGRKNGSEDHTIILFPEACGTVTAFDENFRFLGQLINRQLVHDRIDGLMWGDSPLMVRSNCPALDWQFGQWQSPTRGQIRLGPYKTLTSGSWQFQTIVSTPTGTTCGLANETIDPIFDEVVVNFTVDDPLKAPPVFYAGHAIRYPSTRTNYAAGPIFDTADLAVNPIMEATPQFDSIHRRSSWALTIRDISGGFTETLASALAGTGLQFDGPDAAHLMCDYWVGDHRVLCQGIVTSSGHDLQRRAEVNQIGRDLMGPDTKVCPILSDQWALLDEWDLDLAAIYPVGDGLRLGAYIYDLLLLIGLDSSALTNVSSLTGRRLPQARPGENWCVQPGSVKLGDWIRSVLGWFGNGRQLWIDSNGVWNLGFRSQTSKFVLLTNGAGDRVFKGMAAYTDSSQSYNYFRVEGADGPYGLPLIAWWDIYAGYRVPFNPGTPLYIGRRKAYGTEHSSAFVTQNECDRAVRSLRDLYGLKPGRGFRYENFFLYDVYPGDYGTVDGRILEVVNVTSGGIAFGSTVEGDDAFKGNWGMTARDVV